MAAYGNVGRPERKLINVLATTYTCLSTKQKAFYVEVLTKCVWSELEERKNLLNNKKSNRFGTHNFRKVFGLIFSGLQIFEKLSTVFSESVPDKKKVRCENQFDR